MSDPPPRPERAPDSRELVVPEWAAGAGADPSTHPLLVILSVYSGRVG